MIRPLSASKDTLAAHLLQPVGDLHPHEMAGRVTELVCQSCGELLQEVRHVYLPKPPRRHRKKRINKKWRKRWARENRAKILASSMMSVMRKPIYRCTGCGRSESFYGAVGRNLIQVQPLPEGALPLYSTEGNR